MLHPILKACRLGPLQADASRLLAMLVRELAGGLVPGVLQVAGGDRGLVAPVFERRSPELSAFGCSAESGAAAFGCFGDLAAARGGRLHQPPRHPSRLKEPALPTMPTLNHEPLGRELLGERGR